VRLAGAALAAVHGLCASPGIASIVRTVAEGALGIAALRRLPASFRGPLPDENVPRRARPPRRWSDEQLGAPPEGRLASTRAYLEAYARGASPIDVAERAIDVLLGLHRRQPSMNVLAAFDPATVRADAAHATERLRAGRGRPLEGVPFLVKDQHDVTGLPTRFGSGHHPAPATHDATLVARLRSAGAVLLGKTVMTEWGISPVGTSVHDTLPRNPHDPDRVAGGSSTGSAVAVSLGIGPFASGADAGGSIRLPASFAGVFGLKPTFGRISRSGEAFSGSVNHLGVLGASALDQVSFLDAVASDPDESDRHTLAAPIDARGHFGARLGMGVRGLRIGIDVHEWRDCELDVAQRCRDALGALERDGAVLVPIRIPLAVHAAAIGIATMAAEGSCFADTTPQRERAVLGLDAQLALQIASKVSAGEYLDVQRLRVGLRHQVGAALRSVDVIALPTVPISAPRITAKEMAEGFSDGVLTHTLCRHNFLANLTGLPAASAPVGKDRFGIPVGLQIIADAWDEASLLAVLAHLERCGASRAVPGAAAVDLLGR
jgi:aspartyl-tRNA(Asn)/glutamyl-tRNA(Gln) amidotransferase subunit A